MNVVAGAELHGGVNPRRDRRKLDNCVTRVMQDVMKHVRVASNRHLRNWEAPHPATLTTYSAVSSKNQP